MRRRRSRARARRRRSRRWALRAGLLVALVVGLTTALPVWWVRERPPPATAFTVLSRFADPATGLACPEVERRWVDWGGISREVPLAVVLAEDQRFLQHRGFDLRSIERAVNEHEKTGRLRGASTLSQQVAKNLFLWPGRSWLRKALEAWYTLWIEAAWSKRRILEVYLNVAQFGPCVFGVEAAAQRYFGCSAAELDEEQAALLAAVLPNPAQLRAWNPGPYAQERTEEILLLMRERRGRLGLRRL